MLYQLLVFVTHHHPHLLDFVQTLLSFCRFLLFDHKLFVLLILLLFVVCSIGEVLLGLVYKLKLGHGGLGTFMGHLETILLLQLLYLAE